MEEHIFHVRLHTLAPEMVQEWLSEQVCRFKIWNLFNFIQLVSMVLDVSSQKVFEEKEGILPTLMASDLWNVMRPMRRTLHQEML